MQVFLAVAEFEGFAAAARHLNTSPASVTRAIARLEARLGAALLQRSTRNVALTEAGVAFRADCTRIFQGVEDADASAKGLHAQVGGQVVLLLPALFSQHVMAPLLSRYLDLYPDISLVVHYHDRFPNMTEEGLDVAVWIGELPASSLIARPVGQVRHWVCASPGYLDRHGEPRSPDDLEHHRLVATQVHREWLFWDFCQDDHVQRIRGRARLSCTTVQAAITASIQGAGLIRCLSYPLYAEVAQGRLRRVLQAYELPALPVQVLYREGRKASMRVRSVVDFMVEALREHPALRPDVA